ncbi:ABC transporter substrate-binding protein [Haloarculaceae archaeon H-GB2-1]|nr:ABC transporter substrate-binding protein [Haloarculaceae archaeon H-GB1-1]MEA5387976.1 ABC transporter substrate-binding protein [Haloarculaceae archaeon H-GB11]MEA5409466.1 ABC transporter substrate-binding protein [Haloarculaceae archaeon H-GB2-1]
MTESSRRKYLKMLGIGGLAGLAGCQEGSQSSGTEGSDGSDGSSGSGGSDEDTTEEESEVLYGGTLRLVVPQTLVNWSPFKGVSGTDYVFRELMYSRLTELNLDDTTAIPELATEWEPNNSYDAWTFMLNEDATFPNGDTVTASDVQATVDYMVNDLEGGDTFLAGLQDTEVVDDHTITLKLDGADTEYPRRMPETGSNFIVAPKRVLEDDPGRFESEDYGSGPFNLVEATGGNKYVLEGRDDYHNTDSDGNELPFLDTMEVHVVSDQLAATNGLVDLRYDGVQQADHNFSKRYEQGEQSGIYGHESMELINVLLNVEHEPFDNPNVRKAIKYAVSTQEMLDGIDGNGSLGYHHNVAPIHKLFADDIDDPFGREARPEKARELLEKEGYSGDTLLELPDLIFSKATPEKEVHAQLFQQQMANAGIEFDIQLVTSDTWLTEYWNKDEPWYFSSWGPRAIGSTVMNLAFRSGANWNSARYSNDEFDQVLTEAMTATDPETKREKMKEAQQILHLDGPWIVTTFLKTYGAWNDYVENVDIGFSNEKSYFDYARLTSDAPQGPSP